MASPIVIELKAKADEFMSRMGDAEKQIDQLNRRGGDNMRKFQEVGKAAFFGLGAAAVGFGAVAIKSASDLNEQMSKAQVVFGGATKQVTANVDQLADKFGVQKTAALEAASSIGLIAKASGLAQGPAAELSNRFTNLAVDASSFYNVPLEEALGAIRSGLVGESEPMRRFGVLLSEDAVKAEAYRLGIASVGAELTDQQKVQARSSLIIKGMSDASGDLERTQDSLANRMREFRGRVENLTASIGTALLPVVSAAIDKGTQWGGWLADHKIVAEGLAVVIGGPLVAAMTVYIAKQAIALGMKVVDFFTGIASAVRTAIGTIQTLAATQGAANASTGLWVGGLGAAAAALGFLTLQVQQNAAKQKEWAHNFTVSAGTAEQAIEADKKKIKELQEQLDKHGAVAHIPFVRMTVGAQKTEDQIAGLKSEVGRLEAAHEGMKNKADAATGALGQEGDTASTAKPKLNDFETALAKLRDTESSAKDKADAFKTAIDLLIGSNIDAEKAAITYKEKVQELGESLKDNGKDLDINTDSGRKNRTAIEDTIIAAKNHLDALQKQGASLGDVKTAFDEQVSSIKNTLTYYGYSKTEIDNLLNRYGMIPSNINTILNIDNSPAFRSLQEIKKQIDEVNEKAKNGYLPVFTTAGPGGVVQHRAGGGPVRAGMPYVVGEHRPELFIPDQSGTIMSDIPRGAPSFSITIGELHLDGVNSPEELVQKLQDFGRRNGGVPITVR